jgi:SulP family sulfate permease
VHGSGTRPIAHPFPERLGGRCRKAWDRRRVPENVIIDLSDAQIYDSSTAAALDAIELKYHRHGKNVEIIGLNEPGAKWHSLSGRLGAGH